MKSILRLDKVVFDKIEFNRLGFKNDTELKLEIQTNIGERKDKAAYKVTVIAIGEKLMNTHFISVLQDISLLEQKM